MSSVSKTKSFLLALLIIIGLIFLNFPHISSEIKNFFYSISNPAQRTFDQFVEQIKNSWKFLNSLKYISEENIHLEEKISELTAQNTELKELKRENEFLRSYLDLPGYKKYQVDLANIIGRDFQGLEKFILIDKGNSDGIEKNMSAVAFKNILIGKVIEVFDNSSKVLLITSSNSNVPALIQESRTEGLIKGKREDVLSMDLVSKDRKVEKDQTVITSGTGGFFSKGLLIGKVSIAEFLENEMFQKIEVVPAANIEELERIFIIKKQK